MSKVDFADDRLGGLPNRLLASDPLAAPIKVARVVACLAMVLGVAFVVVPAPVVAQASPAIANRDHGYPYPNASDCDETDQNGSGCVADKWRFFEGQCTSWVAYRLNQLNFKAEKDFHNYYKVHWGNASNWGPAARSVGITVDDSPRKGDVAWWGAKFHVAYVEEVYADGSVLISEMNYDYHNAFRMTTLRRGVGWPDGFIHIKDVQSAPSDRDGDGVPDAEDKCPDVPGSASTSGCPDRDGDGTPDAQDACPDEAGPRSNSGCPEKAGGQAAVHANHLFLFATGSDGKMYYTWRDRAAWKWKDDWAVRSTLPAGVRLVGSPVTAIESDHLFLFATGSDGKMYYTYRDRAASKWSETWAVRSVAPTGVKLVGQPSAIVSNDQNLWMALGGVT
jgi:surface antigen